MSYFLDDCQTFSVKTKIDPKKLLEMLNSINPAIQFNMKVRCTEVPFLNLLIKRSSGGQTGVDIKFKPADTRRCPSFPSKNHVIVEEKFLLH